MGEFGEKKTLYHTTGLSDANRLRLPFSSSFLESAFRWNVVWRVFWLVEASILILWFAITCFIISPRVVGLPSLPAEERSIADKVKDSVA
jgi:hypothetical protein